MKKTTLFFLLLTQFISAQQQKDTLIKSEELKPVIISATLTKRQLADLPMPASLVSKKEIKLIGAVILSDILDEQNGLVVTRGLGGTGIQLQGLGSAYVMIMIDGVPLVGRFAGNLDLERISLNNVRQIEIVKGASSGLYGNEALAGVVNIITEKPRYGFSGSLHQLYGSYNRFDTSLDLSFKNDKFWISSSLNRNSFGGYKFIDTMSYNIINPHQQYTFNLKSSYQLSPKTKLKANARFFTQKQQMSWVDSLTGKSDAQELNVRFKVDHKFSKNWQAVAEYYMTNFRNDEFMQEPTGDIFYDSYYNQTLLQPSLKAFYKTDDKNEFTVGLGYKKDRLKRNYFSTVPELTNTFGFLQWDGKPVEKLNVILALRADIHNEYASQISPKLAVRYRLLDDLYIKASYGKGFKAPDFRQLYLDFSLPQVGYTILGYNMVKIKLPQMLASGEVISLSVPIENFESSLLPETSNNLNIGATYKPNNFLKFNFNIFRNDINNLIDNKVIALKSNGQKVISYYNVSKVFTQGIELSGSFKINPNLKVSTGYQYLIAKNKDAVKDFKEGKVYVRLNPLSSAFKLKEEEYFGLFNRSRHTANFKLFYQYKPWKANANLRLIYRSKYGLYDTNKNGYLDDFDDFVKGYVLSNMSFNKKINKHFALQFGVQNLLNYVDVKNYSVIKGRTYFGKISINF